LSRRRLFTVAAVILGRIRNYGTVPGMPVACRHGVVNKLTFEDRRETRESTFSPEPVTARAT